MTANAEKKEIAPHKGGRTARFECRINPEVKAMLKEIADREGRHPCGFA